MPYRPQKPSPRTKIIAAASIPVLLLLMWLAVRIYPQHRSPTTGEYEVYTDLLPHIVRSDASSVVLLDSTYDFSSFRCFQRSNVHDQVPSSAANDFTAKNKRRWSMQNNPAVPYKLLRASSAEAAWKAFGDERSHGNGVRFVLLSRVGFDYTHQTAAVAFSNSCGGDCGGGGLLLGHKKDGRWEFAETACHWLY